LHVACALGELLRPERSRKKEIIMFCDEAHSYGSLDCLINAYSTARAYRIRIWTFWTDLGCIRELYRERTQSLIANSTVQVWLGTKEPDTAEHISRQAGWRDSVQYSKSVSYGRDNWPSISEQRGQAKREVVMAQEVQNLPVNEALVWVRGIPGVIRCKHKRYYEQWRFFFRYEKNPLYRKH
jgi:type IV secretory pathway TraG/TraD family ATPase VirD4